MCLNFPGRLRHRPAMPSSVGKLWQGSAAPPVIATALGACCIMLPGFKQRHEQTRVTIPCAAVSSADEETDDDEVFDEELLDVKGL